jgi:hypothetical protein
VLLDTSAAVAFLVGDHADHDATFAASALDTCRALGVVVEVVT